jgi:hypothetical protein
MKGKHVMNAWKETIVASVGEVSGSEKESANDEENDELNAGSDNWSVNDEMNQSNPLALLLSQATQPSVTVPGGRMSARLPGGTEVQVALHSSAQNRGCTGGMSQK